VQDAVGDRDDAAASALAEDRIESRDRGGTGINEVAEHVARADGVELVDVAYEQEVSCAGDGAQQRGREFRVQHRGFVNDDEVRRERVLGVGGETARRWIKQKFFFLEAQRLQQYEPILNKATAIAGISPMETAYLQSTYGHTHYIPAFHSNNDVASLTGKGEYVLYHGNLSIPENDNAAIYLASKVFPLLSQSCIIAGSNPSQMLQKAVTKYAHIQIKANLTADEIFALVRNAHVNALVTFQSTGIKLKLLNALYRGRHIVANTPMVEETGLENLCQVSDEPKLMADQIKNCFLTPFTEKDIEHRTKTLGATFNNKINAGKLLQLLHP
jgi:hypothetical protein